MELLGSYLIATVVQLPFHVLIASPWLITATLFAVLTRRRLPLRERTVLVSGIAAAGLAPAYGAHLSMMPAYALIISGDAPVLQSLLSFLATWTLSLLVGWLITRNDVRRSD
jgi:surface polysaccharide O-acyltransferase-like enzyme